MKALTASEARRTLFPLIEDVVLLEEDVFITSRKGTAVLISAKKYESLIETIEVLSDPYMSAKLAEGVKQSRAGIFAREFTVEEFEAMDFDALAAKEAE